MVDAASVGGERRDKVCVIVDADGQKNQRGAIAKL